MLATIIGYSDKPIISNVFNFNVGWTGKYLRRLGVGEQAIYPGYVVNVQWIAQRKVPRCIFFVKLQSQQKLLLIR